MMDFLWRRKPKTPAKVISDTVVPLHGADDSSVNRSVIANTLMRFDDVLDPEKLRWSLARLMELGDWRKLGARLRLNDRGDLEYHVPECFSEERPGLSYRHTSFNISIEEHPLASRIPKATARPSVQADPADFRPLILRPGAPKTIDDYLYSDEPQLSLYVVSFEDATLVSLSWPHTMMDAMGRRLFMDAWVCVLHGQEDNVPPLHGFDFDPLVNLGTQVPETSSVLFPLLLSGFGLIIFVVRYMCELLWWREEACRTVCLPQKYVRSMQQTALQELTENTHHDEKPFVSEGDVICAWWLRTSLKFLGLNSNRTIIIMSAFSLRSVLSSDLLPKEKAFVSNAATVLFTHVRAKDLFSKPVGYIASLVRQSIQQQGTREQLEAVTALFKKRMRNNQSPPVFGDARSLLVTFTSLTKGRFFDMDFSPAVVRRGRPSDKRTNALGKPSMVLGSSIANGYSPRYVYFIFGQDAAGNYFTGATLRKSTWASVEQEIAAM